MSDIDLAAAYAEHRGRLLATCTRLLGDAADAEDALHETFARVARRSVAAGDVQDLPAYLSVVTRSVCVDMLRRRHPRSELSDATPSGEDVQQRAVAMTALRRVFACLTPRERSLLMGSAAGLSCDELAVRDGGSPIAVARALVRARARARSLGTRFGGLPAMVGHVSVGVATRLTALRDEGRRLAALLGSPRSDGAELAAIAAITVAVCGGGNGTRTSAPPPARPPASAVATPAPKGSTVAETLSAIAATAPLHGSIEARQPAPPASRPAIPAPPAPHAPGIADADVTTLTQGPGPGGQPAVYATGTWWHDCPSQFSGSCPVAFRSDDGGTTWQLLAATGYHGGALLAVNGGATLLTAAPDGLERSDDGGATFRTVMHLVAPIAVDPGSPPGDARVLVGTTPLQVYDTATGATSAGPLLPPGVASPSSLAYAAPGRVVLAAVAASGRIVLASCDNATPCRVALDTGDEIGYAVSAEAGLVIAYQDGEMLGNSAASGWGSSSPPLYVSTDGGNNFSAPDGTPQSSYLFTIAPERGGPQIIAASWRLVGGTTHGTLVSASDDAGGSFRSGAAMAFGGDQPVSLLGLGGGRVIAAILGPGNVGGVRCSPDDGLRWEAC